MSARRPAFTLVEIATVLAIMTLLVPTTLGVWRQMEDTQSATMSRINAAGALRSVSEELRHDAALHALPAGAAVAFAGPDRCDAIHYDLQGDVVVRVDPCGAARPLARHVARIERSGRLITLVFRVVGDERELPFAIGLAGAP